MEEPNLEQKIIETARELFVKNGFEQTSMSDIAATVGINRPTLHYYFRTKDIMFKEVFSSVVESFLPRIQDIFTEDIPFGEKLERTVDQYFDAFEDNPSLPFFILGEIHRDIDHLLCTIQDMNFDKYLKEIEKALINDMESGKLKRMPVPVVFSSFYSMLTFPFLSKNLIMTLFYDTPDEFAVFIAEWKRNILRQMECLLDIKN